MLLVLQKTEGSYDEYTEPVHSVWDVPRDTIDVKNEYTTWVFNNLPLHLVSEYYLSYRSDTPDVTLTPKGVHNPKRNSDLAFFKHTFSIYHWLENVVGAKKLDFTSYVNWE